MDNKKFLVDYYSGLYNYFRTNHNHREVAAWGGLIFNILFCSLVAKVNLSSNLIIFSKHGLTFIIILVAGLIHYYIFIQLKLRDQGACYSAAALYFLNKILQEKDKIRRLISNLI